MFWGTFDGDALCEGKRKAWGSFRWVWVPTGGPESAEDGSRGCDVINLSSLLYLGAGLALHARRFAAALSRKARVALIPWDRPRQGVKYPEVEELRKFCVKPRKDGIGLALGSAEFTQWAVGRPRISSTVWETTRVPERWLRALRKADDIWVPSEWGRSIFESAGLDSRRIHVVPGGVDSDLFTPAPNACPPRHTFRFISVGKWENRKCSAELVRAFCQEFRRDEDVELVMHCGTAWQRRLDIDREISAELARVGAEAPRVTAGFWGDAANLLHLMRNADAFVLPTRAEGWGLAILEAMSCALPCIVTDYSALRAFANEQNSYLIRVQRMCPVNDPEFFACGQDWGEWAEPDFEHLRYLMRYLYEHRDEAREKGQLARQTARQFSWDRSASIALSHLR
jgi:glycosyltransferase involved in cell wall biosynthesis